MWPDLGVHALGSFMLSVRGSISVEDSYNHKLQALSCIKLMPETESFQVKSVGNIMANYDFPTMEKSAINNLLLLYSSIPMDSF